MWTDEITHARTPTPLQVQVAAADARPDLFLPAGKHEALVYVWCVDNDDDASYGHTPSAAILQTWPLSPPTHPPTHPPLNTHRKVVPGQPLVEPWSYEETFLPHLAEYLETSRAFRDSLTHIPRG